MPETIGQQLGAARKSLGLSIEDVAHKTRIHRDVLRQLEADELDQLPNLMFAKSFIKIYSEHVNVDAGLAISQLTAADTHHGEQYLLGAITPRLRESFGRLTSRIPVRPILASAAAVVVLAISGSYLASHLYGSSVQPKPLADGAGSPEPTPAAVLAETESDAQPEGEPTAPVSKPDPALVPKTVPRPSIDSELTEIERAKPVEPGPIPKARKAVPVKNAELGESEEPELETASSDSDEPPASEADYEPFVVTPGVAASED